MLATPVLIAFLLAAQVPPPDASARESEQLREKRAAILGHESETLSALAKALAAQGDADASAEVRASLPAPPSPEGSTRLVLIPDVVVTRGAGLASRPTGAKATWRAGLEAVRADSAKALFELARRAALATPKRYAFADECLRAVIDRQPDHPEARRLLGQVRHGGGWASPFAVDELRAGKALHPVYGWVREGWVAHLDRGELPENGGVAKGSERWIPAEEADTRHRDWSNAWAIQTEHFQIRTNVPLAESIAFGRHLEALHEVFQAVLADVIGENLPLALRFKSPTLVVEKKSDPHQVSYFAERQEYIDALRPIRSKVEESLGFYRPPASAKSKRGHAYFFRDKGGDLPVTATLFHEVSHQLMFESGIARPDAYKANDGNFWVFEGLGTYFETLRLDTDGSARVGGLVGPRNDEARKRLVADGALVPTKTFVRYDSDGFNRDDVYRHYQQASALTTYLMDGHERLYREGFLAYVRDACKGSLKRGLGRSLEERTGTTCALLDMELLAYLKGDGTE